MQIEDFLNSSGAVAHTSKSRVHPTPGQNTTPLSCLAFIHEVHSKTLLGTKE